MRGAADAFTGVRAGAASPPALYSVALGQEGRFRQIDEPIRRTGVRKARGPRGRRPLAESAFRAYLVWLSARRAAWAFLKAIRPLASWSRARWFSSFFDQRIRSARLRLSQEWQASTTQRRARQPGVRSLSAISSPRVRMCAVKPRSATSSPSHG